MAMWPRPPAPMTQQGHGLADRVVGGQPGVGQGGHVGRLELGVDLDHRPCPGLEVRGHATVGVETGEEAVHAVHVVAGPAVPTEPAGRLRVQDDGVPWGDVADVRADLVDPAGVLVAQGVGQRRVGVQLVPLAQVEVDVCPAHPGAADLDDHVVGALDLRLFDLVHGGPLVVLVQPQCRHRRITSVLARRGACHDRSIVRYIAETNK
jgi:hypothetical protein